MSNRKYTDEDHRRAFEIYWQTRVLRRVSDEMGLDFATVKSWSGEYACTYACPWHNWDRIRIEREAGIDARLKSMEMGIVDPVQQSAALEAAVAAADTSAWDPDRLSQPMLPQIRERQQVVESMVRSDLERASQWELLYSKIFFQLTGIALDHRLFVKDGQPVTEEELKQVFEKGLTLKNMDNGIKALALVQDRIDQLRERMGVYSRKPSAVPPPQAPQKAIENQTPEKLGIEELRRLNALLRQTPKEQVQALVAMSQAENVAFENVLQNPAALASLPQNES